MIIRFRKPIDGTLLCEIDGSEPAQVPRVGEWVELPGRSTMKVDTVRWLHRKSEHTDVVVLSVDVYLI